MSDKEKNITANNESDVSKDSKTESRRDAVRKMLAGGGVATGAVLASNPKWSKPILNTVVLPAHGQMSGGTTPPATTAPVTTAPVTTAPVTTAPVTTAPVTTAPVTTAPVTTTIGNTTTSTSSSSSTSTTISTIT